MVWLVFIYLASQRKITARQFWGFEVEIEQLETFGFSCSAFDKHSWINITHVNIEHHLKLGCFYCKDDLCILVLGN